MSVVHFNVGGIRYSTSTTTLNRDPRSMLATMLLQSNEINLILRGQEIFIDRNGKLFEYVLDYLRDGATQLTLPSEKTLLERLLKEADFFQLNEYSTLIKQKLNDVHVRQPTFAVGSTVKFNHQATTSLVLQDYLDMMNNPDFVDVKFGPDMQDRLKPVPCWFCHEPAAQKLSNRYQANNTGTGTAEEYKKYHAILIATWGQICSRSETCCLVKFIYPKFQSAVVLKDTNGTLRFERTPVNYVSLHVPILFLELL